MVEKIKLEGYEAFQAKLGELTTTGKIIYVMFSGSKDDSGKSWCPDCVVAEPVVDSAFAKVDDSSIAYVYVGVGGRAFWKDPKCVFRTDPKIMLKSVPTLIKWGTPKRLEEAQCAKEDMINMLLEED